MLDDVSSQHGSRGALWSWGPMRGDSSCPGKVLVPRECPGVLVSWCPGALCALVSCPVPPSLPGFASPSSPSSLVGMCSFSCLHGPHPKQREEGGPGRVDLAGWTWQAGPGRQDPSPRFLLESELILSCAAVFLCLVLLVQPRVRGELSSQS